MAVSSETDALQIRKYPNRRYYDTTRSRHVRLQDIRKAVQDGHIVCVRDSKSDTDITNQVLGQIVLSDEDEKLRVLPAITLHAIIRCGLPAWRNTVEKLSNLIPTMEGWPWEVNHMRGAPVDPGGRSKSKPANDVLISQLQNHVDAITAQIGELRRGRHA